MRSVGLIVVLILIVIVVIVVLRRNQSNSTVQIPGGINDVCTTSQQCASGLECFQQKCRVIPCYLQSPVNFQAVTEPNDDLVSYHVSMSWDSVPGAETYFFYVGLELDFELQDAVFSMPVETNSIEVDQIPAGVTFYTRIIAFNKKCGTSQPSASFELVLPPIL
jgi:hypothetical protein